MRNENGPTAPGGYTIARYYSLFIIAHSYLHGFDFKAFLYFSKIRTRFQEQVETAPEVSQDDWKASICHPGLYSSPDLYLSP